MKKKRILFAAITILISSFIALVAAEQVMRYRRQSIERSDHRDRGLIAYDSRLGWVLTPNWKGRHKHHDFEVGYSTNHYGFRGNFRLKQDKVGRRYAFVGDSFTFSYGVNDYETFVALLNAQEPKNEYLNFGVPGYSTDQEYLLIQERVFKFSPDVILLVVYLGNDLFDNQLAYPIQAARGKPYFDLSQDGLTLQNTPVPLVPRSQEQVRENLKTIVFGDNFPKQPFLIRYMNRFELFRLLQLNQFNTSNLNQHFDSRFKDALRLFTAIVEHIRDACDQKGIRLGLILMPGRSFIERPESPSALFQDYLRRKIVEQKEHLEVKMIDLASLLRERFQIDGGRWYHPHEGHMTPEGHRVMADILADHLDPK